MDSHIAESPKYIPALDGVRAIAVFGVLLVHWGYLASGWIGVQVFFVLSGYLITAIFLRERQQTDSLNTYSKRFY